MNLRGTAISGEGFMHLARCAGVAEVKPDNVETAGGSGRVNNCSTTAEDALGGMYGLS